MWSNHRYVERRKDDTGTIIKLINNYLQISVGIIVIDIKILQQIANAN
jgi:hypothetical protein